MSKRFVTANAEALASHLRASGMDPEARTKAPNTLFHGGTSEGPHPDVSGMREVKTCVSGSQLHRTAVKLGLPINDQKLGGNKARQLLVPSED